MDKLPSHISIHLKSKKLQPITDPDFKAHFKIFTNKFWKHLKCILHFNRVAYAVVEIICRWKLIFRELGRTGNLQWKRKRQMAVPAPAPLEWCLVAVVSPKAGMCLRKARQTTDVVYVRWAAAVAPGC